MEERAVSSALAVAPNSRVRLTMMKELKKET